MSGGPGPAPDDDPRDYPDPSHAWYAVAILTLANVSGFVDRQILSLVVAPMRRDLGVSDVQVSYLMGLSFALFYTVLGVPLGRVADRSSRRALVGVGVALWSVMTALSGLARSYPELLLARIGVGVGEATLAPAAVSLIADYFPRARRGTAMSVYALGIFVGSGLAYLLGGLVVGLAASQASFRWPLVGDVRPWQSVFLMVGLPGLLVALLFLTVREPPRRGRSDPQPLSALLRWVRDHARLFTAQSLGFAMSATVNFGIAAWLATFLVRTYGWSVTRAGVVQGTLTMTVGVLGVVSGGRLADRLVKRGVVDGPLRVGVIGALGMLVFAGAYPLSPSAALAVALLVPVNFFAAFPWGAANAAAAEILPNPLRAQGAALHFLVVNLVSGVLGPTAVATVTERVFGDPGAVRWALSLVTVVGMTAAIALLLLAMPAYRHTVAERQREAGRETGG